MAKAKPVCAQAQICVREWNCWTSERGSRKEHGESFLKPLARGTKWGSL